MNSAKGGKWLLRKGGGFEDMKYVRENFNLEQSQLELNARVCTKAHNSLGKEVFWIWILFFQNHAELKLN